MHRRETALPVSVPSAPSEASQERSLQQIEEPRRSDRAERVREKLPIWMALIDPKPLTRQSIRDVLTEAFTESALVAVSTCEELLEMDEGRIAPSLHWSRFPRAKNCSKWMRGGSAS
jgi:hypothetical protein